MKLTRTYLKQLIKEEMGQIQSQGEEESPEENPKVQELRQKLIDVAKTMTGVAPNEIEMVNFFIELIDLAKRENIAVGEFKRRIGIAKQAAEKIAK